MALTGLEIYKLLPKTNCKECGFPTCLAFAMQLASKKISLDKCPYVSDNAKQKLESASRPPINLVKIGKKRVLQVGNETVMFRHEEKFYNSTGIGFIIEDNLSKDDFIKHLKRIEQLRFERVGQQIEVDLIALKCTSNDKDTFYSAAKDICERTNLALILVCDSAEIMKAGLEASKENRPLCYAGAKENLESMIALSKEFNTPIAVKADTLNELAELTQKVSSNGINDIVIDLGVRPLHKKIEGFTYIRRMALKRNFRPFGYPILAFTSSDDPFKEAAEAATLITKYANIVILRNVFNWEVLPLLTVRQNIYTDPQKPLQVEPKIYEIGSVTDSSPVLVTTNFSLTYYTVESEVESSKVPSYIISVDSEGMSVLTAWAAEKFTAEKIANVLKESGIKERVSHNEVIIPGYVAVMSGKLQEESGWQVKVGPKEASGIPSFLKNVIKNNKQHQ